MRKRQTIAAAIDPEERRFYSAVLQELRRGRREVVQAIEKLPGERRRGSPVASIKASTKKKVGQIVKGDKISLRGSRLEVIGVNVLPNQRRLTLKVLSVQKPAKGQRPLSDFNPQNLIWCSFIQTGNDQPHILTAFEKT